MTEVSAQVPEAVHFHGGESQASVALRLEWTALRETMRSRGVNTPEDLARWIRRRGFTTVAPGGTLLPEHRSSFCQMLVQSTRGSVS